MEKSIIKTNFSDQKEEIEFIKNVEKFPAIYDVSSSLHKPTKISEAFRDIAENIGYEAPNELALTWRKLRQKYIKIRNLDPNLHEPTIKKNAEFLKAMCFLDDFDLDEPIGQTPTKEPTSLVLDDDDPHYEDTFIAEVKKYPMLYDTNDPDNKKTKLRQQIWEEIGTKFGINEKRLQLKWKNLKRKYILMRYPQSSKNAVTQKRKIKYSQKFVDKLSFLDTFLEHAKMYQPVDSSEVYENEIKRIKMDHNSSLDQDPFEGRKSTSPSPKRKLVVRKEKIGHIVKLLPKISMSVSDNKQMKLEITDDDEEYEEYIEDVDYLAEDQHNETDSQEAYEKPAKNPIDLKVSSVVDGEDSNDNRRSDNEHFCLSLVEPLSNLPFNKQVILKTKIWNLLAESYNS